MNSSAKCVVLDLHNSTLEEIAEVVSTLKLENGRAMVRTARAGRDRSGPPQARARAPQGKADKTDLSHEAVWGITSTDGMPVVVITGPVTKKFAVQMLYQGAPVAKLKVDFVLDSTLPGADKTRAGLEMVQDRLLELASEAIPAQSTHPYWKGKVSTLEDNFPKLVKVGKTYTKDGVSGQYDPSFTVSMKTPSDAELTAETDDGRALRASVAAYDPPAPEKVSKGYNDSLEAYVGALRKLPPFTWSVKVKGTDGATVSNDVLLEKRNVVAHVMFELNSLMIKPVRTVSMQLPVRQIMLCSVASNKRRLDDADLDALWLAPAAKAATAGAGSGELIESPDY